MKFLLAVSLCVVALTLPGAAIAETNDIDVKTGGIDSSKLRPPIAEKMTWKRMAKATWHRTKNVAKGCTIWKAQTLKNDYDWWAGVLSNPKVNTATGTGSNLVGLGWYGSNWIIRRR